MATKAAILDFQSMWKQHYMSMHTRTDICTQFQEDWTTLKNRQSWSHGGNLGFFFENENIIKSLRTSICIYISNFVKIQPFLTKLAFWWKRNFTYDVIAAIYKIGRLYNLYWTVWWKTPCHHHVSTILGSWGVVTQKMKMAAVAILDDLVKKRLELFMS